MDIEELVQEIESEMERRLLSQSDIAEMAGLSRQVVSNILKRHSKSKKAIRKIRKALGLGPVLYG